MITKIRTDFITDPLAFLKDYVGVIILIPVLLGGIWQIVALSCMSFSFVRFFSGTQLVADGLLILIIIASSFIITVYYQKVTTDFSERKGMSESGLAFIKKYPILSMSLYFLVAIASFLLFEYAFVLSTESFPQVNPFVLSLIKFVFIFLIIYFGFVVGWKVTFEDKNKLAGYIFTFGLLFLLFNFSLIAIEFHKKFFLPSNLINVKPIEKNLKKEYKVEKVELLYFNDKYLFYSIGNTGLIKIIAFDKLTDSE
ncbi:MAG: hypothetical protein M0D53_14125 [Flavobacterium sp. JAD_PAG50586_2]|nr:MAG: hypothetical protein M0D53_14125 [Flavobacterium sp. JAD_PAG50586_2]